MGLTDLAGLALTKIEMLSHYSRIQSRFNGFKEICLAYEQEQNREVLRLNDGDGILLRGEGVTLCRA